MKTSICCKTRPKFLFYLILILIWFALILKTDNIIHSQTLNQPDNAPLHVISDKMIAQQEASMVEFIGNVKATRRDSIIFADSIKIYFTDTSKNKDKSSTEKDSSDQDNIKKIISTGNVRYTVENQKAFADKAVYTTHDQVLILTGKSPKLITGSSFVTGKKITLFRIQNKVIVESDGIKKVEAFFNPEDNITKDKDPKNKAPKDNIQAKQ